MNKGGLDEKLKNWPIKKKLIISFGTIIVTTFILIVALLVGMKVIESKVEGMFSGPITNTYYINDIRLGLVGNQRAINRIIAVGSSAVAEETQKMEDNAEMIREAYDVLAANLSSKENKESLEIIWNKVNEAGAYREELVRLFNAGRFDEANEYDEMYYSPAINEIREQAELLDASIFAVGEQYTKDASVTAYVLIIVGIVLLIVITWVAVVLALRVTNCLTEPIKQIEAAAKQLRVGDLSQGHSITYESEDELGELAKR